MSLTAGTRLGPYEVIGEIGAGGMGMVYRAHDSRLGRQVAIKVLPPNVATDANRRQRFEREARAVAALNHPHICAIHDVGSQDGVEYLVLELVAGETLSSRVSRGPMPIEEALACARDIADAVSHAHRHGIVHRDLKPANVILGASGAKVLDFGLATVTRPDHESPLDGATVTAPITAEGTILGTLQYMSPEQVEGRPADERSDIFAFGTILYEMLSGRRAFAAKSTPGLIGAILRDQPEPITSIRPDVPGAVDRLIRACLEKKPDARLASMHDAGLALEWSDASRRDVIAAPSGARGSITRRAVLTGGISLAGGLVGGLAGYALGSRRLPVSPSYVFDLPLPAGTEPGAGIALSPDGRRLVVSTIVRAPSDTGLRLYVRELSGGDWQRVAAVRQRLGEGAYPFWSPDGSKIACLLNGNTLVQIAPPDGKEFVIASVKDYRGGVWLEDGTIVYGTTTGGLMRVAAAGGTPAPLLGLGDGDLAFRHPVAVGPRTIAFLVQRLTERAEIRLLDVSRPSAVVVVTPSNVSPAYDRGTLFFEWKGSLVGTLCDARGQMSGGLTPVAVDTVASALNNGFGQVTAGGGAVAVLNSRPRIAQAVWVSRDGTEIARVGAPFNQIDPVVSPDGRSIAIARAAEGRSTTSIWLIDAESGGARQLTSDASDQRPVWSPDGTRIVFRSSRGIAGTGNLYWVNVEGPPVVRAFHERFGSMYPGGWAADGQGFLWSSDSMRPDEPVGIFLKPGNANDSRLWRPLPGVNDATVSTDGARIAFSSQESGGRREVFVDTVPPQPRPIRVSRNGGEAPEWRRDGRELYFVEGDRLMAVSISADAVPQAGPPVTLFAGVPVRSGRNAIASSPDGSRFLTLQPTPAEHSVKVTTNWTARRSE